MIFSAILAAILFVITTMGRLFNATGNMFW